MVIARKTIIGLAITIAVILSSLFSLHLHASEIATISISKFDDKHLKVIYQPASDRKSLPLASPYEGRTRLIREEWKPLDDCGYIDDGVVTIQNQCSAASFLIPIEVTTMDRVYPTAYPFGNQGVLLHTGAIAISDECCNIIWNFDAGDGAIIIGGVNLGSKTSFNQISKNYIAFTGVFLSSQPIEKAISVIASDTSPAWLVDGVIQASSQISHYYKKTYPKLNFKSPTLFISNIQDEKQSTVQADVSSLGMIRFGFVNAQETPNDAYLMPTKHLVAHELAHLLQPNKKSTPVIHEGGAEFIRWMAEYKLGWQDKNAIAKQFSDALLSCLNNAGDANWSDLELNGLQLGNDIYNCGLVIHVIALASRQNLDSAEKNIYQYYQHWKVNDDANFAQYIECGNQKSCEPKWLTDIFMSKMPFANKVDSQLNNLGIVKTKNSVEITPEKNYYEIDIDRLLDLLDSQRK